MPEVPCRLVFVTGTDTGVGKTVLTGLLLTRLRARGTRALAIKPFCSGGRGDVALLRSLQENELTPEEINPFFFFKPLAPLAAAQSHRQPIELDSALLHIRKIARRCDCLLIEGIGGLLVPLGHDYTVLDLIHRLRCEVLVAARNQLGTLNHTLLTVRALTPFAVHRKLRPRHPTPIRVILMQPAVPDISSASNPRLLGQLLKPVPVTTLPYLGPRCDRATSVRSVAQRLGSRLDKVLT